MRSVKVTVHGRVHGVGYRWFTRDAAETHAVSGWVRNRRDGAVEAELHGTSDGVEAVLAAMRYGPRHSRVEELSATEAPESAVTGFEIRPTT